jgi:hypothetical protein
LPYRNLSPRSLFRAISRPSRRTIAAGAVAVTAALTAGVATGPGPARPIASGLPAIAGLSQGGGAHLLTGGMLTLQPAGGHARPAAWAAYPAGSGRAGGGTGLRTAHAAQQPAGGHRAQRHQAAPTHHAAAAHHAAGRHQGAASSQPSGRKAAAGHHQAAGHHHHTSHHRRSGTAAHHKAAPARHPYQMYDSVNPSSIPSHQPVAAYSTGRYYATPAQLRGRGPVMWIDITGRDYAASVLDVEPGDATPSQAASWAWHRLHASPRAVARLYTNRTEWPAVQAAVNGLPSRMRARVHWWIADPTGHPHVVAGASATQWYWGPSYDISKVRPGF